MSSDYEFIMETIENVHNQPMALKNTLIKYENDEVPGDVSFSQLLDDELFEESYFDGKDDCITEIGIIIEHLLKIKYCTNSRNHGVWANSIKTHRGTVSKYVRWESNKRRVDRLIEHTSENIEDCYDYGGRLYYDHADPFVLWKIDSWEDKEYWDLLQILSRSTRAGISIWEWDYWMHEYQKRHARKDT